MNSFLRHATQAVTACLILNLLYGFFANIAFAVPGRLNDNNSVDSEKLTNVFDDTNSIVLSWTAPGNDDYLGRADHYLIKYSNGPITESNWGNAIPAPNPPAPLDAGTTQNFILGGLSRGEHYYIAIKTYDEAGNCSVLSNVASFFASGIMAPVPLGSSIDTSNNSATVRAMTIETSTPVYYEFAIDTLRTFTNPTTDVDLLADSIADVTFGSLRSNIAYFWHCRAVASDHSDSSVWCATDSFNLIFSDNICPTVNVAVPSGGESWPIGSVHDVTWSDNDNFGVTNYSLEYSTDSGDNWVVFRDWISGDPHTFSWTIPNVQSAHCRIRVSCRDAAGNIGFDMSNSDFAIIDNVPPIVTVSTPNGRERWDAYSAHNITWTDSDNYGVTQVKLEYSTNGGSSWILISDWTGGDLHSYVWSVPETPSRNCRMKVSCKDASNNIGSDVSNRDFTIRDVNPPHVNLVFPNGGESLEIGFDTLITWQADDLVGVDSFMIDYSIDSGSSWNTIASWTAGNPGLYHWLIPPEAIGQCFLRVFCMDTDGNAGCDSSNSSFYNIDMISPTVSITNPGINDTISADSIVISWSAQDNGAITNTGVEYSVDDGVSWNTLWNGAGDTSGTYVWLHPEIGNLGIRVRCTDQSQNIGGDSVFFQITDVKDSRSSLPRDYSLSQSYPNPFNPSTTIEYGLPQSGHVTLELFDTMGRQVAIPVNENQSAGYHNVTWNADNFPSGAYFYRIHADGFSQTKKMLLVK